MSNILGKNITLTLFGESHGDAVGAVLDGMPCGIEVSEAYIAEALSKRRPSGSGETARVEKDSFKIVSGVFEGFTTGEPICIIIENSNTRSADYDANRFLARPSHADFVSHIVHQGYEDWRGGGHFSGRLTAPIVALGAICAKALENVGVKVGTHILSCGGVQDDKFCDTDDAALDKQIDALAAKHFPVLKDDVEGQMKTAIEAARMNQDSIGGIIQTAINHLPVGIGEPWFGSLEGQLANAMLSIGGITGIAFGMGFGFGAQGATGRSCNDEFYNEGGTIKTRTNNNGGINGGYSNGMPVVFNCAVKPTPSIAAEQHTVDLATGENATIKVTGRHDPAIIRRICPVVTAMTAIVICDALKSAFSNLIFEKDETAGS